MVTFANDEAGETSTFQGTIPQALELMNGELMSKAVGGEPGSFLANVVDQARLQKRNPLRFAVNQLYAAALNRAPTDTELQASRGLSRFQS